MNRHLQSKEQLVRYFDRLGFPPEKLNRVKYALWELYSPSDLLAAEIEAIRADVLTILRDACIKHALTAALLNLDAQSGKAMGGRSNPY